MFRISHSPTPAGCPRIQLNSDTIYLEIASDPEAGPGLELPWAAAELSGLGLEGCSQAAGVGNAAMAFSMLGRGASGQAEKTERAPKVLTDYAEHRVPSVDRSVVT